MSNRMNSKKKNNIAITKNGKRTRVVANSTRRHTNKTKNENIIIKIIIFIIIAVGIIIAVQKLRNNTKKEYYSIIINNKDITSDLTDEIIEKDNTIYLSIEDIQKYIDSTIYQEQDTGIIITTSSKKVATLELDKNTIEINGSNVEIKQPAYKEENEKIYIPITELENVYDIEITTIESSKNIIIDYYSKSLKKAYTTKNVQVKEDAKRFSRDIEKVKKGNWVVVIEEENGWSKVRTQEGYIGYVKQKNLTNYVTEREDLDESELVATDDSKKIEIDITKENIKKYKKRKVLTNKILEEAINKESRQVEIVYNKEKDEKYERFKIELEPVLKECGIKVLFK